MDTQTQIERLIELAIVQRTELKELVAQLPQLREHLSTEIEKAFDEAEPQLRAELEEWTTKQTADKTAALGVALEAKIADLAKSLEVSTQARYNAIIAEREENARLAAQAEAKIAEHAASLPGAVKEIVSAELARFPRAGEIDQLRKEFAEPRGLTPRGKWQAGETYNKLDFVTINGDSYASNIDNNRTRPSRSSADWTLVAARGTGGGGGPTSLSELTTVPSDGDVLIGSGTSWVTSNLTAGAGISITVGPGAITISATDGDITLDDGTAASPSLHFTNDPDTGIYRPAANTLGISVSGTQVAYFDENGLTVPSAGVVAGGSIHASNGNANNPSLSFSSDQDTGFFRHQPNEIGIALGGTQYATLTSTTFSITPNLSMTGNLTVSGGTATVSGSSGYLKLTSTGASKTWDLFADNGGSFFIAHSGVVNALQIAPTTANATLAGNLTVSGTGTSSFSGPLKVSPGAIGAGYLNLNYSGADVYFETQRWTGVGSNFGATRITGSTSGGGFLTFSTSNETTIGAQTFTEQMRLTNGGNLLIGTTTDGGQKLQVSGTGLFTGDLTVSSGGLTVSKTSNDALLTVSTTGAGAFVHVDSNNDGYMGIRFKAAGVDKWTIGAVNGNGVFTIARSGGATNRYFELSTTGDATFAGNVTASGSGDRSATVETTGSSNAAVLRLKSGNGTTSAQYAYLQLISNETSGQTWNVGMYNEKQFSIRDGSTPFLTIANSTGDATFAGKITTSAPTGGAGAWELGVANAVSPTAPNRTITIEIGGTVYYLHAKTTND